ncbi:hypothetical protein Tco_0497705 [Tanacetum coccineum]
MLGLWVFAGLDEDSGTWGWSPRLGLASYFGINLTNIIDCFGSSRVPKLFNKQSRDNGTYSMSVIDIAACKKIHYLMELSILFCLLQDICTGFGLIRDGFGHLRFCLKILRLVTAFCLKTDFASWQQRIRLYCQGKENGVNILKSIDEGPFQMGTFWETLAEGNEGALYRGPERPRVYFDLSPEDKERYNADIRATNILLQGLPKGIYTLINHYTDAKDIWDNVKMLLEGETIHDYYGRFVTAVKLNRGLRDSNFDQLYAYLKQHEAHANENKMMLDRFTQHTVDPLALMSNVSHPQYHSLSSTTPPSTYVPSYFSDNTQPYTGLSLTDNLIENLTNTLALLTQSYKTYIPQTSNQLKTSSNTWNQATVQDDRVVVQNVQGRQNRGQGNNPRGGGHLARNCTQPKHPQNSDYFKNKMLLMQAQDNGVALDEEQLLFLAGGQDNAIDEDVDEQPVHDLALNVDNVF